MIPIDRLAPTDRWGDEERATLVGGGGGGFLFPVSRDRREGRDIEGVGRDEKRRSCDERGKCGSVSAHARDATGLGSLVISGSINCPMRSG